MKLAGIVLFTFNRPDHTRKTLEALSQNFLAMDSSLLVFSDGPKNEEQVEKIEETRRIIESFRPYFKNLEIIKREKNFGLAKSIIEGVTIGVDRFNKVIVIEDDILTSKYFLKYMNHALEKYENFEDIGSIMGYSYPHDQSKLKDTFFLPGADCWGWATWKSKWKFFESDGQKILDGLKQKNLISKLDFDGSYPYSQMLQDQIDGKVDSWAIRWKASAILNELVTLYPNIQLANNIGNDGSGRHSMATNVFDVELANEMPKFFPENSKIDLEALNSFKFFLKQL